MSCTFLGSAPLLSRSAGQKRPSKATTKMLIAQMLGGILTRLCSAGESQRSGTRVCLFFAFLWASSSFSTNALPSRTAAEEECILTPCPSAYDPRKDVWKCCGSPHSPRFKCGSLGTPVPPPSQRLLPLCRSSAINPGWVRSVDVAVVPPLPTVDPDRDVVDAVMHGS